ncbi:hypothetical protein Q427_18990 [Halomonas sp. BC04]|nr:hypothetical protein Q427_18990 [Halomonas sp. BC04]
MCLNFKHTFSVGSSARLKNIFAIHLENGANLLKLKRIIFLVV